jgi:5-methylcytosine-specific restriction endonuclease McrA
MRHIPTLEAVSDDQLMRRLPEILRCVRRDEADLIAHIAEIDVRRLWAREAASSMFAYCVEVLHLSEPEAGIRIHVARTCLKHPVLLEMLGDGRIHLSGISLLAPVLTPENRETLVKRATHQSKRRIEEIVAETKPRPRVPAIVRRFQPRPDGADDTPMPRSTAPATPPASEHRPDDVAPQASGSDWRTRTEHRPDDVRAHHCLSAARSSRFEPVASESVRIHFTASADLREKLERLQALMQATVPDGDLGKIIHQAVTEKLERLERRRFAKTKKPRKSLAETDTRPKSRHIPAPVRRAVHERDGGRCTYRDKQGRRCAETRHLEFHHRNPFGKGGEHRPENLTLHCWTHNNLMAERDFGKEVMWSHRQRSSSALPDRTLLVPVSRRPGHG